MLYNKHVNALPADTTVIDNADETRFIAVSDAESVHYSVSFTMDAPIHDTYIMLPACAYDGNRFEIVQRSYPPMFHEDEFGLDVPIRMTEVPHLKKTGDSKMEVTTGDLAVPCVCLLRKSLREAFIVYFDQGAHGHNHGITLEQTENQLKITITAPTSREMVYRWYAGIPSLQSNPSEDRPLCVTAGQETVIGHKVFTFPCADIPALYEVFFDIRHQYSCSEAHANLPFSRFWHWAKTEMDHNHFAEGHYTLNSVAKQPVSKFGMWQPGWVGGGINSYPMLSEGDAQSIERSVSTLLFAADCQSNAGFFYAMAAHGQIYHDCFGHYEGKYNMLLIRKHADLTFFLARQLVVMEKRGMEIPSKLYDSLRAAADALVTLWKRYGQLGQFVNAETGEILVGGSTSGAMAPAALCAAYGVLGDPIYVRTACEIAEYFYSTFTCAGVTTGGPGEILQAPDSESAAALMESYMALYEVYKDQKWLDYTKAAVHQLSSWVVNYDYQFPKESRFEKMGIHSAGSVWANVQNKHSAPGLCTISPAVLLKLYRATDDHRYLDLMQQIAHFIPQVSSYPERPMITVFGNPLAPSDICERVNMSDWEGYHGIGDSICGPGCWPTVSLMLTWLEVPGVYVRPKQGIVCTSDHVQAYLSDDKLCIHNPTAFEASVKVLCEDDTSNPLGAYWQDRFIWVTVQPGETTETPLSELYR